jgi:molecular chaperone DnaK (HSP70)
MWANHEDYKKEHNIIGWSDKDMNVKQLIVVTIVSTLVGISGYLVGTYYGSISMLDTMYGNVESELDILESKLKDVNTRDVEKKLEEIKTKVLNKVPSKESIAELNKQVDSLNERLLLLSKELMEVHMELEMELSDLEDNTKAFINDKVTKSEEEVKKQFGEMYDKLDVLYKELEEVSILVDKAKETFLGKAIFKENE